MGIKDDGIKHCHRAYKRNTPLEPSLKVLFFKIWMRSYLKRIIGWAENAKIEMAAFSGRKLVISVSILLRKPCLGSKREM